MVLANEFEKGGAELIFVTQQTGKTDEERTLFGLKGLFALYESVKILNRTQRGRLARAYEGKLPGGLASQLYGYDYAQGRRHINQEQEQVVCSIYRLFKKERLSIGTIVSRLASIGVPSPSGKDYWNKPQIVKMLKNRAYLGETNILFKFINKEVSLPEATPAIISKSTFEQAQAQLKRNKEFALRNCA